MTPRARHALVALALAIAGGSAVPRATAVAAEPSPAWEVARVAAGLLASLTTTAPPRDREVEAAKAKERAVRRFGGGEATA